MAAAPWNRDLDVAVVGDGLYVGAHRIPMNAAPEFLAWMQEVVTGGVS